MTGADVKAVQQALNRWGADPSLVPDGAFGSNTDRAVRAFQEDNDLVVDGIVGRNTRRELFPVGVATTTVYAMRLRMPEFPSFRTSSAQPLSGSLPRPLTLNPPGTPLTLTPPPILTLLEPTQFPRLFARIAAPRVPELTLNLPTLPGSPASGPFGFVYDHVELQPGGQSTFSFNGARVDAFVLTMQNVYRRGPDDGAHQELALGVQIGAPFTDLNGPWTFNPFLQLTDVDRIGALGAFHLWQPYAQAGVQFSGLGNSQPVLTGSLFPVNLGLDLGQLMTLNFAGGLAMTMDLQTGQVQAGAQLSAGLTIKLGKPNTPLF